MMIRHTSTALVLAILGLAVVNDAHAQARVVNGRVYRYEQSHNGGRWTPTGERAIRGDHERVGLRFMDHLLNDIVPQRNIQYGRYPSREAALQHIRQQIPVHQRRIAPPANSVPTPSNATALRQQIRSTPQTTVTTRTTTQAPSNAAALELLRQQFPSEQIRTHSPRPTPRTQIEKRIGTVKLLP
jgi:hypothetical protein